MSNRRKLDLAKLADVTARNLQRAYGGQVTREQLDQANADAVRRNMRTMEDRPGHVPQRLLDDLAAIAGQLAAGENADRMIAASSTRGDSPAARTRRT